MKIRIEIGSATAASSRHPNEDRLFVGHDLWLLSDGASFSPSPAEAASAAVVVAQEEMGRSGSIRHAVAAAHAAVADTDGASTLVLVHHVEGTATIASVGDGAAYRLTQDEVLEQLIGVPRDDPAFLGVHSHPPVPVTTLVSLRPGDRLLVCTDGVHGALGEKAIAASLAQGTAQEAADALVARAHRASDRDDDATAIVLDSIPDRSVLVTAAAVSRSHHARRDAGDGGEPNAAQRSSEGGPRPSRPTGAHLAATPIEVTSGATATRRLGPATEDSVRVSWWRRRPRRRSARTQATVGPVPTIALVALALALALGVWVATRSDDAPVGPGADAVVRWEDTGGDEARLVEGDDPLEERDYACDEVRIVVTASTAARFESAAAALTWFNTVNVASC